MEHAPGRLPYPHEEDFFSSCTFYRSGKGNFVVRVDGKDDPIVELLGLTRPFPPLKALDMDDVCEQVLTALE